MKIKLIFLLLLLGGFFQFKAQTSCNEILNMVKSKGYGTTYYSINSDAIRQVTFYNVQIDYKTYYFAVVKFTSSFNDYIYQVSSNTQYNYSMAYLDSAGKAFWNYIEPYNKNLGCAPNFN